jgi:RsiW-degrading membrane proteinase PrsW (M82 family)
VEDLMMKKRDLSLLIFMIMLILGMLEELSDDVLPGDKNINLLMKKEIIFLICAVMLLCYVVPFALFIYHRAKRWQVKVPLLVTCFISGWFIPGWIAGTLNDDIEPLIKHCAPVAYHLLDAIEPPIVEETLKVIVVFWVLSLFGRFLKKHILLAGMSVGLGFQFGEDLTYIADYLTNHYVGAFKLTIEDRISTCLISHTTYTAVFAIGLYEIFIAHHPKKGLFCLFVTFFAHAVTDFYIYGALFFALSGGLLLFVFYRLYQETNHEAVSSKKCA